jgi:hypothetical protein
MDLPRYCIVGARPVKAIETEDGGMDILAYDWSTGEFARHMEFLTRAGWISSPTTGARANLRATWNS